MDRTIALVLMTLIVPCGLKEEDPVLDVTTAKQMDQREEYLHQELTQLLQEVKWRGKTFSVWQQWLLWIVVQGLSLHTVVCWLSEEFQFVAHIHFEQGISGREDSEEEEDLHDIRPFPVSTPSSMQILPDMCNELKELVGDLLGVCRILCKKNFMPQMYTAIGRDSIYEDWSVQENAITYRLLVFLQPPPGHSFSLEPDTTGQWPARPSRIRVLLECMCSREQLLGGRQCFLHHPEGQVPRNLGSNVLHSLCTDTFLDVEKVTPWVQVLVSSAWQLLPQSHHCQLTVLPSSQSCRFQLTTTSRMNIYTEMFFAVQ